MKHLKKVVFFCLIASATSSLASDEQLQKDFEALRNVSDNYEVFGTVCEQVARLRITEIYPAATHEVVVGIEYANSQRTIGELDVVVLRKEDNEAIVIAEVKCWKDLSKALKKANEQMHRFQNTVESHQDFEMHSVDNPHEQFLREQFDENPKVMTISQDGGNEAGFDMELGLDLEEVTKLRQMLLSNRPGSLYN